jgi:hypothetical protein
MPTPSILDPGPFFTDVTTYRFRFGGPTGCPADAVLGRGVRAAAWSRSILVGATGCARRLSLGLFRARVATVVLAAEREAVSVRHWLSSLRGERFQIIWIGANVPRQERNSGALPSVIYVGQIRRNKDLEVLACCDQLSAQGSQIHSSYLGRGSPGSRSNPAVCGVPIGPHTPVALGALLSPARTVKAMTAIATHLPANADMRQVPREQSCALAATVDWQVIADNHLRAFDRVAPRDQRLIH